MPRFHRCLGLKLADASLSRRRHCSIAGVSRGYGIEGDTYRSIIVSGTMRVQWLRAPLCYSMPLSVLCSKIIIAALSSLHTAWYSLN